MYIYSDHCICIIYIYMYNHIPIPSNTNWRCSGVSNQQKLEISLTKNGRTRPISNVVGPCPQSCHRMDWHPQVLSTMASWELPQAGNSPKLGTPPKVNKIMRRSSIDWEFSSKPCLMTPECQTIETIVFTPKCKAFPQGLLTNKWSTSLYTAWWRTGFPVHGLREYHELVSNHRKSWSDRGFEHRSTDSTVHPNQPSLCGSDLPRKSARLGSASADSRWVWRRKSCPALGCKRPQAMKFLDPKMQIL